MTITKLILVALPLCALTANAAVEKGDWELDFSGSYSTLDAAGSDLDLGTVSAKIGYFVSDMFEPGGMLTYLDAELDGVDISATLLGVTFDAHFNTDSSFVPYAGAGFYYVDAELDGLNDDDTAWEIRAGIKQFIAENVAINYGISYMEFTDLELDGVSAVLGLSVFF